MLSSLAGFPKQNYIEDIKHLAGYHYILHNPKKHLSMPKYVESWNKVRPTAFFQIQVVWAKL